MLRTLLLIPLVLLANASCVRDEGAKSSVYDIPKALRNAMPEKGQKKATSRHASGLRPEDCLPREGQKNWIDMRVVRHDVVILSREMKFALRQQRALDSFRELLRTCYNQASGNGKNPEDGIRALNFIKWNHFDSEGNRNSWSRIVEYTQTTSGKRGIPIPKDYR